MGGRIRYQRGGIRGLHQFLKEHGEAVEYELIRLGLRLSWLGSDALTWRDLLVIIKQSPRDSAIQRDLSGPDHVWGLPEHLLAAIFDTLSVANWQRGGDEHAKKPERLERPGVKKQPDGSMLAQGQAMSIEDMKARLGW